jgi:transcription elongation factor Elf1
LKEFDRWFDAEEKRPQYVAKLRLPKGFRCPACGIISENQSLMEKFNTQEPN